MIHKALRCAHVTRLCVRLCELQSPHLAIAYVFRSGRHILLASGRPSGSHACMLSNFAQMCSTNEQHASSSFVLRAGEAGTEQSCMRLCAGEDGQAAAAVGPATAAGLWRRPRRFRRPWWRFRRPPRWPECRSAFLINTRGCCLSISLSANVLLLASAHGTASQPLKSNKAIIP